MIEITQEIAQKVIDTVAAGLVKGVGVPTPGSMCVEAAVCYALGLRHGDDPECVSPALRSLKITLNDRNWSSNAARAAGLRRLAVAQLGSNGYLDDKEFMRRLVDNAIRKQVPIALRAAASVHPDSNHKAKLLDAALACEKDGNNAAANAAAYAANAANAADAAYAAYAAANAAKAARDKALADFAEDVVQILIEMDAPGCQWLSLAEVA